MSTTRTGHSFQVEERNSASLRAKTSFISFGLDDWNATPQTRQHVLAGLAARGWPVTYTNGPHFIWGLGQAKWGCASWRSRRGRAHGVTLNWPGRWLVRWPRFSLLDRAVVRRYIRTLAAQSNWLDAEYRIAYLFHPLFQPYVQELGACHVVYHADDSFSKMPRWTKGYDALEQALVEQASLLIASSPGIARNLPGGRGTDAKVLENGAPVGLFAQKADAAQFLPDLHSIPHPRIGYFGSINPKINLSLVDGIAAREPQWHWIFVGRCIESQIMADEPSKAAWLRLKQRPNVHFLGERLYDQMPYYQSQMDVNTLCYRTDPGGWWTDLSPLKLYEYLAVGVPIVSAPLEVLSGLRHVVATADGEIAWLNALRCALNEGGVGTRAKRRKAALSNDWEAVIGQLDSWMISLIKMPTARP